MRDDVKRLLPWVLIPLLVAGLVALLGPMLGVGRHKMVGHDAPPLALPIVAGIGAADGDRINIDNLRGKVVLVDFWASWCPPCKRSIPILNEIQERYDSDQVVFLGVNVEDDLHSNAVASVHRALGAEFPSVQDRDGALRRTYKVSSLPTLFVVGPDGEIEDAAVGVPRQDRLIDTIDGLLAAADTP